MTTPNGHPMRPEKPKRPPAMILADPKRHGYYGGRNKDGSPCDGWIVTGTKTCRMHSGKPRGAAKAAGAVMVELSKWGLDGHTTLRDAGEVLLRLVTQSAARVELYSRLLGEAFAAAERLRQAHEVEAIVEVGGDDQPELFDEDGAITEPPAVAAARQDLRRIFATGGVGALIGFKYDADRYGRIYAVEEGVRGLARLEAEERDRCANFAAKAVAANLGERTVRLAERQGAQMFAVFGRVSEALLADLDLTAEQLARATVLLPVLLEREVRALLGPPQVIEGKAT